MSTLILASTSPYRQEILRKLNIDFAIDAPEVDEKILGDESPVDLVKRLSQEKALAVAQRHTNALIIGSDQVATLHNRILGKPLTHENATQQLKAVSGQRVDFHTGLCLYNSNTHNMQVSCVPYAVYFRRLSDAQIDRYLKNERPYNCAGSFKSEGLGITLFEKLEGDDPNTLIGLPLIELVRMLQNEGLEIP